MLSLTPSLECSIPSSHKHRGRHFIGLCKEGLSSSGRGQSLFPFIGRLLSSISLLRCGLPPINNMGLLSLSGKGQDNHLFSFLLKPPQGQSDGTYGGIYARILSEYWNERVVLLRRGFSWRTSSEIGSWSFRIACLQKRRGK